MDRPGLISVSKLMQKSIGPYKIAENTTLKIFMYSRLSSPVRQDGERRVPFLDEYAIRRVRFFLALAHFSLCLPLILNVLVQSSKTLVARVIHRPT